MKNFPQEKALFLAALKGTTQDVIADAPSYQTKRALALSTDAVYPQQHEVAARLKINVNQAFTEDKEFFDAAILNIVLVLNRTWRVISRDMANQVIAREMFLEVAKTVEINFNL
jgi:hypothetical protein